MTVHMSPIMNTETLSRELTELDRLLHRIREQLAGTPARTPADIKTVLKRTGGVLRNKIGSEEEVLAWQRKIRAEWES